MANNTALVLSGGGARAAYQVGVLKAIAEFVPRKEPNPFGIICGTSAGAINAAVIATRAAHFRLAILNMEHVWRNFTSDKIYRTELSSILKCAGDWLGSLIHVGNGNKPISLFDNSPLHGMLRNVIPFENIQTALDRGYLRALAVSASCYTTGESISFYQAAEQIPAWRRVRRIGRPEKINLSHLLASSAIPIFFPAVKLGEDYYGDGAVRQLAPVSPALHLGADRIMIIGVSDSLAGYSSKWLPENGGYPSLAQTIGHLLNSAFLDSFEGDIERLQRINRTVDLIPEKTREEQNFQLRKVGVLVVSPSQPLDSIAARHVGDLPRTVRFFMGRTGATQSRGASFLSYLLFEKGFCRDLITLGYEDAMRQKVEIMDFFR